MEHQVEAGDKYDMKLQIKNRETFTNKEQRNFTNKEQRNFAHFYLEIILLRMTKHKIGNKIIGKFENKTNLKRKKLILSQNAKVY